MLMALEHLGRVGLGATSPQLFRATDSKVYVVKLQNNRLGPKVLANEILGARLGELLGLCFPTGSIIKLEEPTIKKSWRLAVAGVAPGRHFACQYLSGTLYVCRNNFSKAGNLNQMAGVMLFDHLLHNLDRTLNRRNLLLRREATGYKMYAIDNSHLFRRGLWTTESLAALAPQIKINRFRTYGWLLKHFFSSGEFAPYLEKIQGLSDDTLAELVEGIPLEWLPHASEREALKRFLVTRRNMAGDIVTCLTALIPDKHRRADVGQKE